MTPDQQARAYLDDYAEGLQELSDQFRERINIVANGDYDLHSNFIGQAPFSDTLHAKVTKLIKGHWVDEIRRRENEAERKVA